MPTIIRHKLLNIPVMLVNFVNSRAYNTSPLHQFSSCHRARIRYKKVCEVCGKEQQNHEILKGIDEKHILTQEQQERLKQALDNQTIEILSFEQDQEISITLIQKSMLVLPSISKGFKIRDIEIFESFKEALRELRVMCKVKYTTRGKEHLGVLKIYKDDLIFIELPFFSRLNVDEITRLKEEVKKLNVEPKLKDYAINYIKTNLKEVDLETIQEKKAILIKKYLEQIEKGEIIKVEEEIENPFIVEK